MKRISDLDDEGIIAYNLRDNGTAVSIFADMQAYRIEKARWFLSSILATVGQRAVIWEPGSSAGDIAGWFSVDHETHGIDIVPAAVALTRSRYPAMDVTEARAEDVEPASCDALVLCEFLEHIVDPEAFVKAWLPLARFVLIGHPLNDPGGIEPGHVWSYDYADYLRWFSLGGHQMIETHLFAGPFPEMVMGIGGRR
jgi:hypothetical protein